MRKKTFLLIWLVLMLLPLGWIRQFSTAYRKAFDSVFAPEWMHIVTHILLFAGLAILVIIVFKLPMNYKTLVLILGASLIVGVLQESLQMFAQGNHPLGGQDSGPAAFDLGVDAAGGLLGIASLRIFDYRETKSTPQARHTEKDD